MLFIRIFNTSQMAGNLHSQMPAYHNVLYFAFTLLPAAHCVSASSSTGSTPKTLCGKTRSPFPKYLVIDFVYIEDGQTYAHFLKRRKPLSIRSLRNIIVLVGSIRVADLLRKLGFNFEAGQTCAQFLKRFKPLGRRSLRNIIVLIGSIRVADLLTKLGFSFALRRILCFGSC